MGCMKMGKNRHKQKQWFSYINLKIKDRLLNIVYSFVIQQFKQSTNRIRIRMAFPTDAQTTTIVHKYQGVVIAEVVCTLILYIVLRIIHFCIWGWKSLSKDQPEVKQEVQTDQRRWDQESWDIYFPILYANHIIAIALPLLYTPSIFVCVLGFIHFALFVALVIVNVFIKDAEPGQGSRTTVSRIIWGIICLLNVILFITGLAGIKNVLV